MISHRPLFFKTALSIAIATFIPCNNTQAMHEPGSKTTTEEQTQSKWRTVTITLEKPNTQGKSSKEDVEIQVERSSKISRAFVNDIKITSETTKNPTSQMKEMKLTVSYNDLDFASITFKPNDNPEFWLLDRLKNRLKNIKDASTDPTAKLNFNDQSTNIKKLTEIIKLISESEQKSKKEESYTAKEKVDINEEQPDREKGSQQYLPEQQLPEDFTEQQLPEDFTEQQLPEDFTEQQLPEYFTEQQLPEYFTDLTKMAFKKAEDEANAESFRLYPADFTDFKKYKDKPVIGYSPKAALETLLLISTEYDDKSDTKKNAAQPHTPPQILFQISDHETTITGTKDELPVYKVISEENFEKYHRELINELQETFKDNSLKPILKKDTTHSAQDENKELQITGEPTKEKDSSHKTEQQQEQPEKKHVHFPTDTQDHKHDRRDSSKEPQLEAEVVTREEVKHPASGPDKDRISDDPEMEDRPGIPIDEKKNGDSKEESQPIVIEVKPTADDGDQQHGIDDKDTEDEEENTGEDKEDSDTVDEEENTGEDKEDSDTVDEEENTGEDKEDSDTVDEEENTGEDKEDSDTVDEEENTGEDKEDSDTENKEEKTGDEEIDTEKQKSEKNNWLSRGIKGAQDAFSRVRGIFNSGEKSKAGEIFLEVHNQEGVPGSSAISDIPLSGPVQETSAIEASIEKAPQNTNQGGEAEPTKAQGIEPSGTQQAPGIPSKDTAQPKPGEYVESQKPDKNSGTASTASRNTAPSKQRPEPEAEPPVQETFANIKNIGRSSSPDGTDGESENPPPVKEASVTEQQVIEHQDATPLVTNLEKQAQSYEKLRVLVSNGDLHSDIINYVMARKSTTGSQELTGEDLIWLNEIGGKKIFDDFQAELGNPWPHFKQAGFFAGKLGSMMIIHALTDDLSYHHGVGTMNLLMKGKVYISGISLTVADVMHALREHPTFWTSIHKYRYIAAGAQEVVDWLTYYMATPSYPYGGSEVMATANYLLGAFLHDLALNQGGRLKMKAELAGEAWKKTRSSMLASHFEKEQKKLKANLKKGKITQKEFYAAVRRYQIAQQKVKAIITPDLLVLNEELGKILGKEHELSRIKTWQPYHKPYIEQELSAKEEQLKTEEESGQISTNKLLQAFEDHQQVLDLLPRDIELKDLDRILANFPNQEVSTIISSLNTTDNSLTWQKEWEASINNAANSQSSGLTRLPLKALNWGVKHRLINRITNHVSHGFSSLELRATIAQNPKRAALYAAVASGLAATTGWTPFGVAIGGGAALDWRYNEGKMIHFLTAPWSEAVQNAYQEWSEASSTASYVWSKTSQTAKFAWDSTSEVGSTVSPYVYSLKSLWNSPNQEQTQGEPKDKNDKGKNEL